MSLSAAKRSLLPQGDVIGKAAALRPCDSDVCPEYAGTVQKPDVAASEQSRTGIRVCGGNQRNAPVCGAKHGIRIARPADLVTDRDLRRHAADRNLQPDVPRVTGENIQVQLRSGERGCSSPRVSTATVRHRFAASRVTARSRVVFPTPGGA